MCIIVYSLLLLEYVDLLLCAVSKLACFFYHFYPQHKTDDWRGDWDYGGGVTCHWNTRRLENWPRNCLHASCDSRCHPGEGNS